MLATKLLACVIQLTAPSSARQDHTQDFALACAGCLGAGGSGTSSGGTCGGMVSIQVTVTSGKCRWFAGQVPLLYDCVPTKGCKPTVTRSWSGLPANSGIDFCLTISGQEFCLDPSPSAGPVGSDGDTRGSADMACSAGSGTSFSVSSQGCGLSASAGASCSQCQGDM